MVAAIIATRNGIPVLRAANEHGVPRSTCTLQDRILGKAVHGTNPGPRPYLEPIEENELSNFLVDTAKAGLGKTRKEIKALVTKVAREKGVLKKKKVTDGWFRQFKERQPQLSLRKGDATANVRMNCLNKETMAQYFSMLKDVLLEHNLLDSPAQIYNVDETGMPLDHRAPKVMTMRGQKKVRCRTSGNKNQITVIACVSATGQAIPPFVIFDAKSLNREWMKDQVPGTQLTVVVPRACWTRCI